MHSPLGPRSFTKTSYRTPLVKGLFSVDFSGSGSCKSKMLIPRSASRKDFAYVTLCVFWQNKKSRLYFDIKNDIENGSFVSMPSNLLAVNNIANGFGENKHFMKMFHFAVSCLQNEQKLTGSLTCSVSSNCKNFPPSSFTAGQFFCENPLRSRMTFLTPKTP